MFDQKEYCRKNAERIATYHKKWAEANPKKVAIIGKKHSEKLKQEAHKKLKGRCILCGGRKNLEAHEKKGNVHPRGATGYRLVLRFPSKFALLCSECHRPRMHKAMKKYGFTFEQVLQYRELLFGSLKESES